MQVGVHLPMFGDGAKAVVKTVRLPTEIRPLVDR